MTDEELKSKSLPFHLTPGSCRPCVVAFGGKFTTMYESFNYWKTFGGGQRKNVNRKLCSFTMTTVVNVLLLFQIYTFSLSCLDNGILQTRSITRASYGMNRPHIKSFGRNSTPQQGNHTLFLNPVVSFGGIYHQTVHVATPT